MFFIQKTFSSNTWYFIVLTIGSLSFYSVVQIVRKRSHNLMNISKLRSKNSSASLSTYSNIISNTPLVKLEKLSLLTGCNIYAKMESMNPSGTGKDRAVKYMLKDCQNHHNYRPGVDVIEGSSGSTGIALAFQCNSLGLKLHVVMPDDQAVEKISLLQKLGANVVVVPCCAISNKDHYVNRARRLAEQLNGIFIDQFENKSNFDAHYCETGPEIYHGLCGKIDAFVMSAGTGGTIAGVSRYLKEKIGSMVEIVLADPFGSSLLNKVLHNVCYSMQQSERTIRKHRYDSIVEGVGLDRITGNFNMAQIDTAVTVSDQEILEVAHWMLRHEGLFIGSSSALNIAATIRTAYRHRMKANNINNNDITIVTIICDNGSRHLSRFWNEEFVKKYNLVWPASDCVPECIRLFHQ
eukprot:gene5842-8062_t